MDGGSKLTVEAVQRFANQRRSCKVLLNGREIKPEPPTPPQSMWPTRASADGARPRWHC